VLEFLANLPKCLVGMEACASADYWAPEIAKLGHEVRLIAPRFVKPYVKANKNDASDAEAICEAGGHTPVHALRGNRDSRTTGSASASSRANC
jgi:transposase